MFKNNSLNKCIGSNFDRRKLTKGLQVVAGKIIIFKYSPYYMVHIIIFGIPCHITDISIYTVGFMTSFYIHCILNCFILLRVQLRSLRFNIGSIPTHMRPKTSEISSLTRCFLKIYFYKSYKNLLLRL